MNNLPKSPVPAFSTNSQPHQFIKIHSIAVVQLANPVFCLQNYNKDIKGLQIIENLIFYKGG